MKELSVLMSDLTPEQKELFLLRLNKLNHRFSGKQDAELVPIQKDTNEYELSFAQQRLWFLDQLVPDQSTYNIPAVISITGRLKKEALLRAFQTLVERHESLRTRIFMREGKPFQVIESLNALKMEFVTIHAEIGQDRQQLIAKLASEEVSQPFNITEELPIRIKLVQMEETEHLLLVTLHHIAADGWSVGILFREISFYYEQYSKGTHLDLKPLPVQYKDYSLWQRKWLKGEAYEQQLHYWKQQLEDLPVLKLPQDYPYPDIPTFKGAKVDIVIPKTVTDKLKHLCTSEKATLFMTLMAAYKLLLQLYSKQDEIIVGTPIANRTQKQLEEMIGFFVNMLVLRTDLSGNLTYREAIAKVKEVALRAYAHQEIPFEQLVQELKPDRDLRKNPLFQATLVLQNTPREELQAEGISLKILEMDYDNSKFDLSLYLWEEDNGEIQGRFVYNADLFSFQSMKQLSDNFNTLLTRLAAEPDKKISGLSLLDKEDFEKVIKEWNNTELEHVQLKPLHEIFSEQVIRYPHHIAVRYIDEQIDYYQLHARANQIANYIISNNPESRYIGIHMTRCIDQVIAILGILKSGRAYIPLDKSNPPERINSIVQQSQISLILGKGSAGNLIGAEYLDFEKILWDQLSPHDPGLKVAIEQPAYIIYTSGSTGYPKGVIVSHRAVSNHMCWMMKEFNISEKDRVLQRTSFSFDASVWEYFLPLMVGGTLTLYSHTGEFDMDKMIESIRINNINILQVVPSLLKVMLEHREIDDCKSLRYLFIGGEKLQREIASKAQSLFPDTQIVNLYGPSEACIDATFYRYRKEDHLQQVPIGRPIHNVSVYVMNDEGKPLPVGVPGELYIGGQGLANGYLELYEETAKRFVPSPFDSDSVLYKTGDLVRYSPEGNLIYLDRIDNQLKLRGFRIEKEEIEHTINQFHAIKNSAVTLVKGPGHQQKLNAFIVLDGPGAYISAQPSSNLEQERVEQWKHVFDTIYTNENENSDFNTIGWNSTYTGEQISSDEMKEWLDFTIDKIQALSPHNVLEIGCGSGLILLRLAEACKKYVGTDLSNASLRLLSERLSLKNELQHVQLINVEADDFTKFEPATYDTIILNSVIQYFPNREYLIGIVQKSISILQPGGSIFLGDIRSLPHQSTLYTSIQLQRAGSEWKQDRVKMAVQDLIQQEEELVVHPSFFYSLQEIMPEIEYVEITYKRGIYHNEMNNFRYDVVLKIRDQINHPAADIDWLDYEELSGGIEAVQEILTADYPPEIVGVKGVPNERLMKYVKASQHLFHSSFKTVEQWREESQSHMQGVNPAIFNNWELIYPYNIQMMYSPSGIDSFDLVIKHNKCSIKRINTPYAASPHIQVRGESDTSNPLKSRRAKEVISQLRDFIKQRLPLYMHPDSYTVLDELPYLNNGKLNRGALDKKQSAQSVERTYEAPRSSLEKLISNVWKEILELEQVGINDNFFDIGGNSLLMVQVHNQLSKQVEFPITMVDLYSNPTISTLIRATGKESNNELEANGDAKNRGDVRRKALQQRNLARPKRD